MQRFLLARFVGTVLEDLANAARAVAPAVPFIDEFFVTFMNDDKMLRRYKRW